MSRFNIVKKGYDMSEVDVFLSKQALNDKQCVQDKSIRIEELIAELSLLKEQISQYKKRESNVNNALITALDKAQEMEYIAKMRYEIELERVKIFRDKWIKYCDSVKENCAIVERRGEVVGVLDSLAINLTESICSGIKFSLKDKSSEIEDQYKEEAIRILEGLKNNVNIKSPFEFDTVEQNINLIKSNKNVIHEAVQGTNSAECLNDDMPSEINDIINNPDFEELCKKLGLA